MSDKYYSYVLVRTDLPLADQIVQTGHACLEAGDRFVQPADPCHLVVLAVNSKAQLLDALTLLRLNGIHYALFCEPDDNLGEIAACTEPLSPAYRRVFRHFPLWIAPVSSAARGPP